MPYRKPFYGYKERPVQGLAKHHLWILRVLGLSMFTVGIYVYWLLFQVLFALIDSVAGV